MVATWERYLTPNSVHRGSGMACLGVGRRQGATHCPPRVLDCHAAVLLVDGAGRLEAGDPPTAYPLAAPVLFWLFPGVPHTYGSDHRGWTEFWTLFDGAAADAYEDLGYLSRAGPVVPLADPTAVRHSMVGLLDTCREQQPGVEMAAAHLVHELVLGAHRMRVDPDGARDASILAALRDGARGPLSVAEQAARLGLSPTALRRAVRRAAGCAPKEYVLRIRLNHAKALLSGSDLAVAEVGREVGYDDPAYFTRIFTQRAGMAPRAFRNRHRRPQ